MVTPHVADNLCRLTAGTKGYRWPLFMHGDSGGGKTCVALCLLDHFGGFYTTMADFVERIRWSDSGILQDDLGNKIFPFEVWRDWTSPHFAVMDELGTRDRVTDFQYETVKRAMDKREGLPSVYISNHSLEHLALVYDDRIASRLSEGTIIRLEGDRRQQK